MKYRIGDICTIAKGATGITKAVPGPYAMVTLAEERKTHNAFQFDANAVIVPLISSTGHGHASMKRVHYQEGKFALGTILCAVIPKNKNQLTAKYLHLYLQQFKDSLLVPLMKGAANVSLPMNKLTDVEVEVPSLEKQLEIIDLEEEAGKYKIDLEQKLIQQGGDVNKLRQSFLREAMQGKLVPQDPKDEPARELLQKIKTALRQAQDDKKGKKQKELPPVKENEIPFEIPENWVWCRLGEIADLKSGNQYQYSSAKSGTMFVKVGDMNIEGNDYEITNSNNYFMSNEVDPKDLIPLQSIIFPKRGGAIATNKRRVVLKEPILIDSNTMAVIPSIEMNFKYFFYWFSGIDLSKLGNEGVIPQVNNKDLDPLLFPLPPLSEQHRIVARLEQLMQLCDELEQSIRQSKEQTNMLLQSALREALKGDEAVVA